MRYETGSYVEELGRTRVFAHEIGTLPGFEHIIDKVKGIERYDRVIAIARKNDVAFLKERPEQAYVDWLGKMVCRAAMWER